MDIKILYNKYLTQDKFYYCYMGIRRDSHPHWQGWKIIDSYKHSKIKVKDIQDDTLDTLVENFFMVQLLKNKDI